MMKLFNTCSTYITFFLCGICSTFTSYCADYTIALEKAKEAALIQTGIQEKLDLSRRYAEKEAMKIVKDIGIEKPVAACVYLYKIYKDKAISFKVAKEQRIKLELNKIHYTINF